MMATTSPLRNKFLILIMALMLDFVIFPYNSLWGHTHIVILSVSFFTLWWSLIMLVGDLLFARSDTVLFSQMIICMALIFLLPSTPSIHNACALYILFCFFRKNNKNVDEHKLFAPNRSLNFYPHSHDMITFPMKFTDKQWQKTQTTRLWLSHINLS